MTFLLKKFTNQGSQLQTADGNLSQTLKLTLPMPLPLLLPMKIIWTRKTTRTRYLPPLYLQPYANQMNLRQQPTIAWKKPPPLILPAPPNLHR